MMQSKSSCSRRNIKKGGRVFLTLVVLACILCCSRNSLAPYSKTEEGTPVIKAIINMITDKIYDNSYGDIWISTWADDDHIFTVCGDGWGIGYEHQWDWRYTQVVLSKLEGSDPNTLINTRIRGLDQYSTFLSDPFKGSVKTMGTTSINGVLYVALNGMGKVGKLNRSIPIPSTYALSMHNCIILKSSYHGLTGIPTPGDVGTNYTFPGTIFLVATFINYGKDGTGWQESDKSDKYVYLTSNDVGCSNGNYHMLARVTKSELSDLKGADYLFYMGGGWFAGCKWSNDSTMVVHIIDNPRKCGMSCGQYNPALHRYIMGGWSFTELYRENNEYSVLSV